MLKGEVLLYHWPPVWLVWNLLYDYWQFLFLFAKQTNPNQSNRRSTVQWYFPPLVFPGIKIIILHLVFSFFLFKKQHNVWNVASSAQVFYKSLFYGYMHCWLRTCTNISLLDKTCGLYYQLITIVIEAASVTLQIVASLTIVIDDAS